MMITYETPAQKYTGKLQGDYTGKLPPPTSPYTNLINDIFNNNIPPVPHSNFLKSIYALYYDKSIPLSSPESRLSTLIQWGVYNDKYTINQFSENSITATDNTTGNQATIHLDDDLESIWAKIIYKMSEKTFYNFLTADGYYIKTADEFIFNVKEGA